MRVVQRRVDNQPRQHRVYSYVDTFRPERNNPTFCAHSRCHFTANTCTCDNGVAQTGAGCPVNGAANCASCNIGRALNQDRTACIRTCTNVGFKLGGTVDRGFAVVHLCFHFAAKACTCDNGVAQIDVDCSANGGAKCASCNTGWTINHAETACIRTCVHSSIHGRTEKYTRIVIPQSIYAHAKTAWVRRARVALSAVPPNALRALAGGRSATTKPSVLVGAHILTCISKQAM